MTERDRWGLRGPVQSCRLQRTWYGCASDSCEAESRGDTMLVEFRPDGALARRWHRNPDGSEFSSVYEYDRARRLMRSRTDRCLIRELSEDECREYDIDDRGRLLEKPATESTSRLEARFHYEYDDRGNWISKRIEGRASDQEFSVSSVEQRALAYHD